VSSKKSSRKKNFRGAHFYRQNSDLKPILVYVPKDVLKALKQKALEEDRSLQKTVKRILIQTVKK